MNENLIKIISNILKIKEYKLICINGTLNPFNLFLGS